MVCSSLQWFAVFQWTAVTILDKQYTNKRSKFNSKANFWAQTEQKNLAFHKSQCLLIHIFVIALNFRLRHALFCIGYILIGKSIQV